MGTVPDGDQSANNPVRAVWGLFSPLAQRGSQRTDGIPEVRAGMVDGNAAKSGDRRGSFSDLGEDVSLRVRRACTSSPVCGRGLVLPWAPASS